MAVTASKEKLISTKWSMVWRSPWKNKYWNPPLYITQLNVLPVKKPLQMLIQTSNVRHASNGRPSTETLKRII